jgi:uncharacterized protein (TIGR02996 family)
MGGEELYRRILDDPDGDAPRLAYADWCEAVDSLRAKFVRLEMEVAGLMKEGALNDLSVPGPAHLGRDRPFPLEPLRHA